MNETVANYQMKNSRIVIVMKYLHAILLLFAFLSLVERKAILVDYPIINDLMFIYVLAFLFIQVPYAIYFRYKYKKESIQREADFKEFYNI